MRETSRRARGRWASAPHDLPQHDSTMSPMRSVSRAASASASEGVSRARLVEIARRGWIGGLLARRATASQQPASGPSSGRKTSASTMLKAMWNSAVIPPCRAEGSACAGDRCKKRRDEHHADQPVEQVCRPAADSSRHRRGGRPRAAGLMALPRLAPSTSARAATG